MPIHVYKLGTNEYVEWSTVTDSPISSLMTREQMTEYLFDRYANPDPDYNELDRRKIAERLDRTDKNNTSDMSVQERVTPRKLVAYNRASDNGKALSFKAIMDWLHADRAAKEAAEVERRRKDQALIAHILLRWEGMDNMSKFGALSAANVITWRDRRDIDRRGYDINDTFDRTWRPEDDEWFAEIYRRWNETLGQEVFQP